MFATATASSFKTARFGKGAIIMRARGLEPLALDEIAARAPSVFADQPHESRSERYTHIPSRDVLQGLWREGFRPFEVRQGGSGDAGKRAFTKHMIRFRHVGNGGQFVAGADRVFPEVIMLNSHDGTSSYRLSAGLFRIVCTNGLVAGELYEDVRIPHKGDVVSGVIEGAFRVVEEFPRVLDGADRMSSVALSAPEQTAFARAAAQLRWEPSETGEETAPIPAEDLNRARRAADSGADLWRTFNRVQEGLMDGGQRYTQRDERGRRVSRRTVRSVNGIDQNRALNRALWTLAEEMAKLKRA